MGLKRRRDVVSPQSQQRCMKPHTCQKILGRRRRNSRPRLARALLSAQGGRRMIRLSPWVTAARHADPLACNDGAAAPVICADGLIPAHHRENFFMNDPARKTQIVEPIQQNYPTGKSPGSPSSPSGKNILIFRSSKSAYIPPVSPDERGGSRSSRTRGGMRWTLELRLTSAARVDGKDAWS